MLELVRRAIASLKEQSAPLAECNCHIGNGNHVSPNNCPAHRAQIIAEQQSAGALLVEEAINTVSAIGKYGGSGHLLDAAKVLAAEVRRLRHFEPLIGGVPINEYVLQQKAEELEERLAEAQSNAWHEIAKEPVPDTQRVFYGFDFHGTWQWRESSRCDADTHWAYAPDWLTDGPK